MGALSTLGLLTWIGGACFALFHDWLVLGVHGGTTPGPRRTVPATFQVVLRVRDLAAAGAASCLHSAFRPSAIARGEVQIDVGARRDESVVPEMVDLLAHAQSIETSPAGSGSGT